VNHDHYRNTPAAELSDEALLFDLRQVKVSIECGPGSTQLEKLEQRQREIYKVLAERKYGVEIAEQRINTAKRERSKLEELWILIDGGVERVEAKQRGYGDGYGVDAMATDDRFVDSLKLARDVVRLGNPHGDAAQQAIRELASALVDMEDDLAQARGLLVAMMRGARKWRDIARGEALDTKHLSQDQISLLLGLIIAHINIESKDCEPEWRALYQTLSAAKRASK
jgi:hypothetical protein